mmetsp:Transcript_21857/g.67872  ORF Transcript_21857/g.67872 Transcript_21857/m.67872 type:complete len:424 (-) Transcript_21857:16-1287(-)
MKGCLPVASSAIVTPTLHTSLAGPCGSPRSRSGDICRIVPCWSSATSGASAGASSGSTAALPKSTSFTAPARDARMFCSLMSRCSARTSPCSAFKPSSSSRATAATHASSRIGAKRLSGPASRSSMSMAASVCPTCTACTRSSGDDGEVRYAASLTATSPAAVAVAAARASPPMRRATASSVRTARFSPRSPESGITLRATNAEATSGDSGPANASAASTVAATHSAATLSTAVVRIAGSDGGGVDQLFASGLSCRGTLYTAPKAPLPSCAELMTLAARELQLSQRLIASEGSSEEPWRSKRGTARRPSAASMGVIPSGRSRSTGDAAGLFTSTTAGSSGMPRQAEPSLAAGNVATVEPSVATSAGSARNAGQSGAAPVNDVLPSGLRVAESSIFPMRQGLRCRGEDRMPGLERRVCARNSRQ